MNRLISSLWIFAGSTLLVWIIRVYNLFEDNEISNGEYANMLFSQFSKERVQGEMNDFLSKEFFPRFGGGIGMTRMIRALKLSNLI